MNIFIFNLYKFRGYKDLQFVSNSLLSIFRVFLETLISDFVWPFFQGYDHYLCIKHPYKVKTPPVYNTPEISLKGVTLELR